MSVGRMQSKTWRAWIVLILVAFVARAAVPSGFMPEFDAASGKLVVAICSGNGVEKSATIDLSGGRHGKKAHADCPYANSGAVLLPTAVSIATSAEVYVFAAALFATKTGPEAQPWAPHAPPTGPPSLA